MDINKIANLIKQRRKALGLTQEALATKLSITEKAISRWETGRGTPDISLLIPLAKELKIDVSELLNGEENNIEKIIEYNTKKNKEKTNIYFKLTIICYIISILIYLIYLKYEYDPSIELNYFIRLIITIISSLLINIGNKIYSNHYIEKIEDKTKINKISKIIVFIYYIILLFNTVIFARYTTYTTYNLIPFKTIKTMLTTNNKYTMIINIFGNLLIYMPLEYFILELFNIKNKILNKLLPLIILIIIELSQLISKKGILDIDDIILSYLGITIFYILYKNKYKYFNQTRK